MQTITTYRIEINDDCSNRQAARFIELKGLTDLDLAKNKLWAIMEKIATLKGFGLSNEGTMYIAAENDTRSNACYFGRIYNEATGEEVELD